MKSEETSFSGLFTQEFENGLRVKRIEVPLIQRDYAQGRPDTSATRIRCRFLDALTAAVLGEGAISLDFVYGDLENSALLPLDGQQRLTTLFLLHWYLAARCSKLEQNFAWKNFTYSTRASARMFCEQLGQFQPEFEGPPPSYWLRDQPWYLQTWEHDPTIQSMLVVLDDIHRRLESQDCQDAWNRLVDETPSAITFHVLPMKGMGLSDDIYIKMNSRGKPLTEFEMFKARFEKLLESSSPERAQEFATKIDTVWTDVFWSCRGYDDLIDDELLGYLRFATDVVRWEAGKSPDQSNDLESLAAITYSETDADSKRNIERLFQFLDTWVELDIPQFFKNLFVSQHSVRIANNNEQLVLFRPLGRDNCDLFTSCCRSYVSGARHREFGWPEFLLFYAVLEHRLNRTEDFYRRLRVVRNLIEGSENELRADRMTSLLHDVNSIITHGSIARISGFNEKIHAADERLKADFISQHPELETSLHDLEDHPLLRGCLVVFDLDAETFENRANCFSKLFDGEKYLSLITGALLAAGDYSICVRNRWFLFGSSKNTAPWRDLFTSSTRTEMGRARDALGRLLDYASDDNEEDTAKVLKNFMNRWLSECETTQSYDWRYYFVRYETMREGASGRYVGLDSRLEYSVCMLNKMQMNSYYRDPYLHAIRLASKVENNIENSVFTGYETEPRWMPLINSNIALRVVTNGFRLRIPESYENTALTELLLSKGGVLIDGQVFIPITQTMINGQMIDTEDRVEAGANLLRKLVTAGY